MSNNVSGFVRHLTCSRWAKELTPEYPHFDAHQLLFPIPVDMFDLTLGKDNTHRN